MSHVPKPGVVRCILIFKLVIFAPIFAQLREELACLLTMNPRVPGKSRDRYEILGSLGDGRIRELPWIIDFAVNFGDETDNY